MVGRRQKVLKLHWLKRPKAVPKKQNLDHKTNNSKPHIWSLSIKFRFFGRKSQSQQKLVKKIIHFTMQFRSKSLTQFTNLNSLNIIKNRLRQHNQKRYSLNSTNFQHFDTSINRIKTLKCSRQFELQG